MERILNKKTAFITGGGQGIGRGIALKLAEAGANIVIAQRNQETAKSVVDEIQLMGREATAIYIDVTDKESVEKCIAKSLKAFPEIQIIINNAGSLQKNIGDFTSESDFDLCYNVNLKGIWNVAVQFSEHLAKHRQGKIINISSTGGRGPDPLFPAYCASKSAAINLTQSLAIKFASHNVNVNAICPGIIWTPMWEKIEQFLCDEHRLTSNNNGAIFNSYTKQIPLGRPQTSEDIGNAAVFLASKYSCNITGQSIDIDGGELLASSTRP